MRCPYCNLQNKPDALSSMNCGAPFKPQKAKNKTPPLEELYRGKIFEIGIEVKHVGAKFEAVHKPVDTKI